MPLRRPYSYLPFYSFPDHLPPPSHYDSGLLPYTCQDISVPPQEHTPIPSSSLIDSILPYQSYNDSYPDPSENYKPPSLSLSLDHSPGSIILAPPSPSFANGKRPASSITNRTAKRARKNREEDRTAGKGKTYSYTERGARACNVCRRLKLRCVGADPDPPCQRCIAGNHHCIFEQSKRGNREKHEYAGESLRNVERTLGTVSRSIRKLGLVSPPLAEATYALPNTSSPSPVPSAQLNCGRPASPKSQQLPDSSLDPVVAWLGKTGPEVEAEPHLRGPVSAPSCNGPMENVDRNMPISTEEGVGSLPVNSILGDTFWDNMLMPGYGDNQGALSGGYVFGMGGRAKIPARRFMAARTDTIMDTRRDVHAQLKLELRLSASSAGDKPESEAAAFADSASRSDPGRGRCRCCMSGSSCRCCRSRSTAERK